ncbi:MAG: hypothetical protein PF694_09335 [Bacteroidetes bacterium]|jgi:archaellum component FlaC|nr:hypothetical protein [Bacteroidota bacterium]
MSNWLETALITIVPTILGSFGGWFFGRKKTAAETKSVELDNVEAAVKIWRESAENLSQQLTIYNKELMSLRQENASLRDRLETLEDEIKEIRRANSSLNRQVTQLKKKSQHNDKDVS